MQTKHFLNDPTHLVNSALHSLTLTNPSLACDSANKIVYRRRVATDRQEDAPASSKNVSIVSGGGSGHEPALAGLVGKGLLSAAVAGTIFASPSSEQVRLAIMKKVPVEKGVLILTLNYTGDVLNFGMAAEKVKAAGIPTEFCAIGDDVGVGRKKGGKVGRRGIAGFVLVLKLCGALAESGGMLAEVHNLAKLAASNIVSVGASLEHVHVPGRDVPEASPEGYIPRGEVEVGMGIHNEPGSRRVSASLPELVKIMLGQLLDSTDEDRAFVTISKSHSIFLLINNLGGVSTLEMGGIAAEVHLQLERDYQVRPIRTISGTFLTSLNGMGFSISILKLSDPGLGPGKSMLDLLDQPAEAVGWSAPVQPATWAAEYNVADHKDEPGAPTALLSGASTAATTTATTTLTLDFNAASKVLSAGLQRLIAAEPQVTRYDTIVGDGDCGTGLKRGAEAILSELHKTSTGIQSGNKPNVDAVAFVSLIATVIERSMDGTSGALFAIFINALAHGLLVEQQREQQQQQQQQQQQPNTTLPHQIQVTAQNWTRALTSSLDSLNRYTPAQVGDRTLIDALVPFVRTLQRTDGDLVAAAAEAANGAEQTKHMKASLGRSVYVGQEEEWVGRVPDPGAWGVKELLGGMAEGVGRV